MWIRDCLLCVSKDTNLVGSFNFSPSPKYSKILKYVEIWHCGRWGRSTLPSEDEDELGPPKTRRRIPKTNSSPKTNSEDDFPPRTKSPPKTNSEDEFPADDFPHGRSPLRRRIPKTNSPQTIFPPRTKSPPKTNSEDEFPADEFLPEDELLRRRIPHRRQIPKTNSLLTKNSPPKTTSFPKTSSPHLAPCTFNHDN